MPNNQSAALHQRPLALPKITITSIENATKYINALRNGNKIKPSSSPAKTESAVAAPIKTLKSPSAAAAVHSSPSTTTTKRPANTNAALSPAVPPPIVENFIYKLPQAQMLDFHHDKFRRTLWSMYSERIMAAYNHKRIFTDYKNSPAVRRALLQRGWLEKLIPTRYKKMQHLPDEKLIAYAQTGKDYEAVAISRLLDTFPAFFIWQHRHQPDINAHLRPYRNVIRRGRDLDFTTKIGLIGCAEQVGWYLVPGLADMSHPRFYRLSHNNEERFTFIKDFQLTQCAGFLRDVKQRFNDPRKAPYIVGGSVSMSVLDFALYMVKRYLRELDNDLIDNESILKYDAGNDRIDWTEFVAGTREFLYRNSKFDCSYKEMYEFFMAAEPFLKRLLQKCPSRKWDGIRNFWILKPAYECRGHGIVVRNDVDEIFKYVSEHQRQKYIVQKYIECPLLIYKTKFDIRQYMLLSVTESKLNIWLYKDCYLRFSGQEFNLDNTHASIHLTNNSVQVNYPNSKTRDDRLPVCNMWSLEQLKSFFLNELGSSKIWESKIFPGFRKNLVAVVMAGLEGMDLVPNTFELYGCDFMLDTEFEPILIEINSNPDMSPSTYVTERLCPMVLDDLIKVIIDVPINRLAPTGHWSMVHEITYTYRRMNALPPSLAVSGKSMTIQPLTPVAKLLKIPKRIETATTSRLKISKRGLIVNR